MRERGNVPKFTSRGVWQRQQLRVLLPSFKLLFKRQEDKVAVALLVAPYHKRLKFSRFLSILLSGALFFRDNPFCLLSIFYMRYTCPYKLTLAPVNI